MPNTQEQVATHTHTLSGMLGGGAPKTCANYKECGGIAIGSRYLGWTWYVPDPEGQHVPADPDAPYIWD